MMQIQEIGVFESVFGCSELDCFVKVDFDGR